MNPSIPKSIIPSGNWQTLDPAGPELQLALVFDVGILNVHGRHGLQGVASVAAGGVVA